MAIAGELKTVTLNVEGMTCSVCPITVKKALQSVDGVSEAKAVYEGNGIGFATVSYDAEKTNVEALTAATGNAGYPSRLEQ
ncbi:MAG: cation transporter [Gammaproteobacteria bacterium]|nr:cation transporter [Gammaproteobacteria bacterium]